MSDHKYGCLMAVIPANLSRQLNNWIHRSIDPDHLAPEGYTDEPHVTIKHGFVDGSPEQAESLVELLSNSGPFSITIDGISFFKGNEDGDVLKLDISSETLHKLNSLVSRSFKCRDKYPDYKPHLTLAYLDPKFSKQYESLKCPCAGLDVTIGELVYSAPDKTRTRISLMSNVGDRGSKSDKVEQVLEAEEARINASKPYYDTNMDRLSRGRRLDRVYDAWDEYRGINKTDASSGDVGSKSDKVSRDLEESFGEIHDAPNPHAVGRQRAQYEHDRDRKLEDIEIAQMGLERAGDELRYFYGHRDSKAARGRRMTRREVGLGGEQLDRPSPTDLMQVEQQAPRDSRGRVNPNSIAGLVAHIGEEVDTDYELGRLPDEYPVGSPERAESGRRMARRGRNANMASSMIRGTYDPEEDRNANSSVDEPIHHTRPHRLLDMPLDVQKQRREGKSAPQYQSPPAPKDMKDRMGATNAARQKVRDEADAQRRQQYERFSNYTDQVDELLSDEKSADQPLQPNPNRMSMDEQHNWVYDHFGDKLDEYDDSDPETRKEAIEAHQLVGEHRAEQDYLNNRDQKYLIRPSPFIGRKRLVPPCIKSNHQHDINAMLPHIKSHDEDMTENLDRPRSPRPHKGKPPDILEDMAVQGPAQNSEDYYDSLSELYEQQREQRRFRKAFPSTDPPAPERAPVQPRHDYHFMFAEGNNEDLDEEDLEYGGEYDGGSYTLPHIHKTDADIEAHRLTETEGWPHVEVQDLGVSRRHRDEQEEQDQKTLYRNRVKSLRRLYGSKTLPSTNVDCKANGYGEAEASNRADGVRRNPIEKGKHPRAYRGNFGPRTIRMLESGQGGNLLTAEEVEQMQGRLPYQDEASFPEEGLNRKTLSSTNVNLGGALVAPPAQGRIVKLKRGSKSAKLDELTSVEDQIGRHIARRLGERQDDAQQYVNENEVTPEQVQDIEAARGHFNRRDHSLGRDAGYRAYRDIYPGDIAEKPSTPDEREDYERNRARAITQQVTSRSDKEKQKFPDALDYVNMAIPKKPGEKSMGDPTRDREHLLNALGQGDHTAIYGLHDWHQDNPGHEQEQDVADLRDYVNTDREKVSGESDYFHQGHSPEERQSNRARSAHGHLTGRKLNVGDLHASPYKGEENDSGIVRNYRKPGGLFSESYEVSYGDDSKLYGYIPKESIHHATHHLNQLKEKRKQEGQKALGRRGKKSIGLRHHAEPEEQTNEKKIKALKRKKDKVEAVLDAEKAKVQAEADAAWAENTAQGRTALNPDPSMYPGMADRDIRNEKIDDARRQYRSGGRKSIVFPRVAPSPFARQKAYDFEKDPNFSKPYSWTMSDEDLKIEHDQLDNKISNHYRLANAAGGLTASHHESPYRGITQTDDDWQGNPALNADAGRREVLKRQLRTNARKRKSEGTKAAETGPETFRREWRQGKRPQREYYERPVLDEQGEEVGIAYTHTEKGKSPESYRETIRQNS